jgi:hypothetical protein
LTRSSVAEVFAEPEAEEETASAASK